MLSGLTRMHVSGWQEPCLFCTLLISQSQWAHGRPSTVKSYLVDEHSLLSAAGCVPPEGRLCDIFWYPQCSAQRVAQGEKSIKVHRVILNKIWLLPFITYVTLVSVLTSFNFIYNAHFLGLSRLKEVNGYGILQM